MSNDKNGYLLLTCFKNEELNLPELFSSVSNQTIRPGLWLLLNDGSDDGSTEMANRFVTSNSWARTINLGPSKRDIGMHYAAICKEGFRGLVESARSSNIVYDFIGLLDADIFPEDSYFEKLMEEMKRETSLGIASGGIYLKDSNGLRLERTPEGLPRGGARLWKKECFEATGGYQVTYSPDVVSAIHAIASDWRVKQFPELKAVQSRPTSSAEGAVKGQRIRGNGDYYLGRRMDIAILRAAFYCLRPPSLKGFGYLLGYLEGMRAGKRIEDRVVRDFFSKESPMDIIFKNKKTFE